MRRTPPVPKQVIPPFRPTNALLQARLIDFDTGSADLEKQHKEFLTQAINKARVNSAFHVRIFGFASHLGSVGANFFQVRNELTQEVRKYASVALGLGASLGLPAGIKSLKNILQTLFSGPNFSGVSFTAVFPPHAVTFDEVDSCLVTVEDANAGVVISAAIAVVTFNCP